MENTFTIEDVKKFWDGVADIYDETNKKIGPAHLQRFTESIKYLELKDGDKVLNIWSRTGNAVSYLNKQAKIDLYNLEVSSKMIEISKSKYPQSKFELTDLEKLGFDDNYFDAILSLETLEHTPKPNKFLHGLYRILKPGKRLVLTLPPRTAEFPLFVYDTFFDNHGEGPHNFLPSKTVKKIIAESGLDLILHKGTLLIPIGPEYLQKIGEKIIEIFQKTPISELGIRQFYVCQKPK